MPLRRQFSRAPSMAWAVIAMMGMCWPAASEASTARMRRVASCPFIRGMSTSIRIASKEPSIHSRTASTPLVANRTRCPCFSSSRSARVWLTGLSSATSSLSGRRRARDALRRSGRVRAGSGSPSAPITAANSSAWPTGFAR